MSEPGRTTTAYKTRLARAILGEVLALAPATLKLGNGAYNAGTNTVSPPAETMYAALPTAYPLTPALSGSSVACSVVVQTTSDPIAFSEVGIFTSDGTLIAHRTLAPQTITSGVSIEFPFTLLPPEGA